MVSIVLISDLKTMRYVPANLAQISIKCRLGQLEDCNDRKIIRSMSGFLGVSKIAKPLIESLIFSRKKVVKNCQLV